MYFFEEYHKNNKREDEITSVIDEFIHIFPIKYITNSLYKYK